MGVAVVAGVAVIAGVAVVVGVAVVAVIAGVGLVQHIYNYYYPTNAAPSTCTYMNSEPPATIPASGPHAPSTLPTPAATAPVLSMQSFLPATAGSIPTSYHSSPSSYAVINFNIPLSSLLPSACDLARLSDAHANQFETVQPVITNVQEVRTTTVKSDAPQNTNTDALRVAASTVAVLHLQTKHLQVREECPPQTKVPATLKDSLTQNKASIISHAKSDSIEEVQMLMLIYLSSGMVGPMEVMLTCFLGRKLIKQIS
ncbi:uncharacterized protein EDB93DRAFT_1246982 [Suillus bovinus]|uniref:uncharacterized protein n=1 Tax=Suillus bovinus TaxID=48563 RepID=UPI001B878631|nr:uncharacterized protein EDB93DRAFT_1246982 [Suillus bovinus]KAG2156789.1 hypothetical protein EDB93DRAFT_1246982 [Suillus bovinus]